MKKIIKHNPMTDRLIVRRGYYYIGDIKNGLQGFQSGPVPGTFTRLRSCIVPAEITELPQN